MAACRLQLQLLSPTDCFILSAPSRILSDTDWSLPVAYKAANTVLALGEATAAIALAEHLVNMVAQLGDLVVWWFDALVLGVLRLCVRRVVQRTAQR